MYIPKYSAVEDLNFLIKFIKAHSFGTLITNCESGMNANHYPFLLSIEDDTTYLWTHLARSNPQWKTLDKECLITFTGPHSYMSPTYYIEKLNVPTWSYTAVHARCTGEVISDSKLERELMKTLVTHYEEQNQTNWDYNLPEDFHEKLLKAIVWIKFKVIKLEGKFKLSQNRDEQDYKNILALLDNKDSVNFKELLKYMKFTSPYNLNS